MNRRPYKCPHCQSDYDGAICQECFRLADIEKRKRAEKAIEDLGITYGGRGPGGEFYGKDVNDLHSHSIWTEGDESWTADELEAIAKHKRLCADKPKTEDQLK